MIAPIPPMPKEERVKAGDWPCVLPDDNGIRPAGLPDRCFYCDQKVGEPHGRRCVVITKLVRLRVLLEDGTLLGTYERYCPHGWEWHDLDFFFNEGSWCADSCVDTLKWASDAVRDRFNDLTEGLGCCCSLVHFEFDEVVDAGPFFVREV